MTTAEVDGKPVIIGLNAYIKPVIAVRLAWASSPSNRFDDPATAFGCGVSAMEKFFVSPVESLLLGFAWGEYLNNEKRHPELGLPGEVSDRLSPFLPDLRQNRRFTMSEHDLPRDIAWQPLPDSHEIGYSESTPDRVYHRLVSESTDFVVCEIPDSSRKSLMDLVASFLGELTASVPADHVALNLGSRDASNEITHKVANDLQDGCEEAVLGYAATDKNDDLEGIGKALDDLVAYNGPTSTLPPESALEPSWSILTRMHRKTSLRTIWLLKVFRCFGRPPGNELVQGR